MTTKSIEERLDTLQREWLDHLDFEITKDFDVSSGYEIFFEDLEDYVVHEKPDYSVGFNGASWIEDGDIKLYHVFPVYDVTPDYWKSWVWLIGQKIKLNVYTGLKDVNSNGVFRTVFEVVSVIRSYESDQYCHMIAVKFVEFEQ